MPVQEKISLARLREAYSLTASEAEAIAQRLWPHALFPYELWNDAFELCWKDFAVGQRAISGIVLPDMPMPCQIDKQFHSFLLALEIQEFFRKLSFIIPATALQAGLNYILENTYEDASELFPDERKILFNSLLKLENTDVFDQYTPDSTLFEKEILAIPVSYYHFISRIFPDTILLQSEAAIKCLCNYPLRKEVKGITRAFVDSILAQPDKTTTLSGENTNLLPDNPAVAQTEDGKLTFRIPPSVWLGRPEEAVKETMLNIYPLPVIAHVLFNWSNQAKSGAKTRIGRLLADEAYSDSKSYRNFVDRLLKEASAYRILQN